MYVCMVIYVRATAYSLDCHVGAMINRRLYRTFQSLVVHRTAAVTSLKPRPNFVKSSVAAAQLSSDDIAVSYAHPVLQRTSRFHEMEPTREIKHNVSPSSPDGDTGGEVAIYDCRLVCSSVQAA